MSATTAKHMKGYFVPQVRRTCATIDGGRSVTVYSTGTAINPAIDSVTRYDMWYGVTLCAIFDSVLDIATVWLEAIPAVPP